jgi:hypothetical protein
MTIEAWLAAAIADAERRGLPELKPLLESLAQATRALRGAGFANDIRRNAEFAENAEKTDDLRSQRPLRST